jgi:short subunit dehydrogenase-like uncharacterized protein
MAATRDLDVVLFGATGFVGKLTAEYLAGAAPDEARIGLAGRSEEKLKRVRDDLGARAADWPLIVADSKDAATLAELAARTTAVATTVGPYRRYGIALVEACAAAGTHYADLTGETLFMRETIERFDAPAEASGARIVHTCGFDSIPSDIGVLVLHQAAGELTDTTLVVRKVRGGVSGGTLASLKGTVDDVKKDRSLARVLADPYALSPDRDAEPKLGNEADLRGAEHSEEFGTWVGPFVMAPVNTRVVRRSNALQDWAYGRGFRYREVMAFGSGLMGRAKALGVGGGMAALTVGLALPPSRFVLDRVLPSPGEGPKEDLVRKGLFVIEIHARTPAGEHCICRVEARGDPGYGATSVMLGQSALCLSLDGDRLPDRAGVLTPATAMGSVLADRLRAAGQTFDVSRAS